MPNLTPKAIIHQRFGDQACYKIEEVQDEEFMLCPGLSISQKKPNLFRCVLDLPSLSVTSDTFKKKRDAEQSAAEIALKKLGIDLIPGNLTEEEAWTALGNRIQYILSNEFISSEHPLMGHIKANLNNKDNQYPSLSSSVLASHDHKAASLCKFLNPASAFNPTLTANLVKKASINQPNIAEPNEHHFTIRRSSPYPSESLQITNSISETTLIDAVLIPCSSHEQVRTIALTLAPDEYYLDVIARSLGEIDAKRIVLSRAIGSSSSDSRLYFVGEESVNVRASYLSGQKIYGDSVMVNIGYHWKYEELFFENLSLQSYYRLIIKKTPNGNYKLSRNAILAPLLPQIFTSKSNWRGSPPKELLFSFCRQHRFSEPAITTASLPVGSSILDKASHSPLSHFQCTIKLLSKLNNLFIQCSPKVSHPKQADAVSSASLILLNWLNLFFDHPEPTEAMKASAESSGITFDPDIFSSFISSPPKSKPSLQSSPSHPNGSIASISYTASLVSNNRTERIEEVEQFEFEMGTGSVIPPLDDAVSQLSISQSSSFLTDPPPADILLSASKAPETTIKLITDSSKILYNVTLLSLTEPPEERMERAFFHPPLSKQRLQYAIEIIEAERITSLIDYGCGSGCLLESLLEHSRTIERFAGVDVSQRALVKAAKSLHSKLNKKEKESLRVRSVILYEMSMVARDRRLAGFEMGTCIEVIEHMTEEEAWEFGRVALGYFRPKILLVSTPNYEYNAVLGRGREEDDDKMQFRNHDHKFEWTRDQFQRWGNVLADQFDYRVDFGGVGVSDGVHLGFASQIAVFYRRFPVEEPVGPAGEEGENVLWAWETQG